MESSKNSLNRLMVSAVAVSMIVSVGLAVSSAEEGPPQELESSQQEAVQQAQLPQAVDQMQNAQGGGDEAVQIRVFPLANLDIGKAKEMAGSLLSAVGQVSAGMERQSGRDLKTLIVRDTPAKIEEIGAILEQADKESAPLTVSLDFDDVPLSKILTTIARMTNLNIVGGEDISQNISIHVEDVPIDDVFDIILKSTGYTYIKEGKVLQVVSIEQAPFTTDVFELQFAPAEQVREAVSHLVGERGSIKSFSRLSAGKFASFLVVTETPAVMRSIKELIRKLDKKRRQLMIEVKFCEVTLDKNNEFGIDWVISGSMTGAAGKTTFPFNDNGTNMLRPPSTNPATSQSLTLGTLSFTDFSATVHALDTKTTVNLIASPRVAAMEGEEAQIVIGDVVPVPLYERNSETGTMEISGYQDEDIGTLLKVTPIINSDDTITLYVHPEVSEITSYTGPNNERPVISTRKVSTVFTLEDGKTVVLGGLMKQTSTNNLNKVPLLGDIPLIGRIFRYKGDTEERTELLIFITPHIL